MIVYILTTIGVTDTTQGALGKEVRTLAGGRRWGDLPCERLRHMSD